ncbi:hypothetical protein SADUNF_Sadunf15G0125300 [Salix dunnii]|uniref:DNA-directed RNA polymerase n=1 Tax=Salix dunnii TaxID=1413687 RepID=A0A835MJT5_9ROSI|nr:hypothetical protein SADUNF_Sadunf15G0125300 [Salix dunnii]
MQSGDIVIGKCAESVTDHRVKLKYTERGMVQKVVRSPRLGDKFFKHEWAKGRSGLFGVSRELPFHNSRSDPDIVIKQHALTSRQTTRLNSRRHKARFLGYMLRCLLEAYTGHRKCDNRDSFRNKRFELASELLERELKVHGSHVLSKIGRVDSLDDNGFSLIGANMQSGDIVIGKCAESVTDHRVKLKYTERGMVQKVVLLAKDEGKNFAVVSW